MSKKISLAMLKKMLNEDDESMMIDVLSIFSEECTFDKIVKSVEQKFYKTIGKERTENIAGLIVLMAIDPEVTIQEWNSDSDQIAKDFMYLFRFVFEEMFTKGAQNYIMDCLYDKILKK